MPSCEAKRYGNDMHCGRCALTWSVRDPEPPQCNPLQEEEKPKVMVAAIQRQVHDEVWIDEAAEVTDEQWQALKQALATGDWSYFNGR